MTIPRRDELVTVQNRAAWPVGLRVCRKDTDELGTVVEHNGEIKVKSEPGRTEFSVTIPLVPIPKPIQ